MNQLKDIMPKIPKKYFNEKYSIKEIGRGEGNINYLLKSNENSFVLRICNHKDHKRLLREFNVLKLLPRSLSPNAYYLNMKTSNPFMIQEFVEGKHPKKWTKPLLRNFARKLAKLHQIKKNVAKYEGRTFKKLDVKKYIHLQNKDFFDNCYKLKIDKDLAPIKSKIENLIEEKKYFFNKLKSFSLIHGDLVPMNLLQNKDITIIDWEFPQYLDNARDFSTFFYDDYVSNQSKWRVKLPKDLFVYFLNEYQKVYKDETLFERVDFWIQIDKYLTLVYLKWKLYTFTKKNTTLSKNQIKFEINKLIKSLNKHLD